MSEQVTSVNEVMELEREAFRRFQAGDIDWVIDNLFMENIVMLPPCSDIIVGRENVGEAYKKMVLTEGRELSWEPIEAHISESDDMAYVYGTVRMKTSDSSEQSGKYVTVWMKVGGEWRVAIEIRNSNG